MQHDVVLNDSEIRDLGIMKWFKNILANRCLYTREEEKTEEKTETTRTKHFCQPL